MSGPQYDRSASVPNGEGAARGKNWAKAEFAKGGCMEPGIQ